jgi:hypothetical protein
MKKPFWSYLVFGQWRNWDADSQSDVVVPLLGVPHDLKEYAVKLRHRIQVLLEAEDVLQDVRKEALVLSGYPARGYSKSSAWALIRNKSAQSLTELRQTIYVMDNMAEFLESLDDGKKDENSISK